ncbi:MAG: cyclodeaminase/cyclohydrolase family protein [Deltaproteobacteria bacterium]|nr:cyclodeaminase/cyclohydrolase family protein [Deltaproteobacteria bacterium]MBW2011258.1 cyclodeaminase/cyclohydrolase family protein [Deltaproteobacteria bacterium]MBW2100182.1 cyclodeaminase/cyclohydrolase family protein [Deltaproteobacteria bacterium]
MKEPFMKALARPNPNPGGGAAAAYGVLVGFALLKKVVRLELNCRQILPEQHRLWQDLLKKVNGLAEVLVELRDEDGKTYLKMAKAKDSGRNSSEFASALQETIQCPIMIMENTQKGLNCVATAAENCRKHLLSDLLVVNQLFRGAGIGACYIAQANLMLMADAKQQSDFRKTLRQHSEHCLKLFQEVQNTVFSRKKFLMNADKIN